MPAKKKRTKDVLIDSGEEDHNVDQQHNDPMGKYSLFEIILFNIKCYHPFVL